MWDLDGTGTEYAGPREALRGLGERARRTILEGDRRGIDVRDLRVRLRDEFGETLFEGTLIEATRHPATADT